MKQQITRFSPHQNGKVFGVLMAVTSLVFLLPFFVVFSSFGMAGGRPPMFMFLALPIVYLVFGYLSVAIGCWVYNLLSQFTGGIEFESRENAA